MTSRTLSALTWPSYFRLSKIRTSWPGNVHHRSGDGFANIPTSVILTTPAGTGSLGLRTGVSSIGGLPQVPLHHHHDVRGLISERFVPEPPSAFRGRASLLSDRDGQTRDPEASTLQLLNRRSEGDLAKEWKCVSEVSAPPVRDYCIHDLEFRRDYRLRIEERELAITGQPFYLLLSGFAKIPVTLEKLGRYRSLSKQVAQVTRPKLAFHMHKAARASKNVADLDRRRFC